MQGFAIMEGAHLNKVWGIVKLQVTRIINIWLVLLKDEVYLLDDVNRVHFSTRPCTWYHYMEKLDQTNKQTKYNWA